MYKANLAVAGYAAHQRPSPSHGRSWTGKTLHIACNTPPALIVQITCRSAGVCRILNHMLGNALQRNVVLQTLK